MSTEIQCYRKGCGKKYTAEENKDGCCQHHPGVPIFHDALKSWSCCEKKSTDFSVFLDMPGCTHGLHSNEKPPPAPAAVKQIIDDETIIKGPPPKPPSTTTRPDAAETMVQLKTTIGATLKTALEKRMAQLAVQQTEISDKQSGASSAIVIGTACKNNSCKTTYCGPETLATRCIHHSGVPVFHEGMKFWSCCQRKTSEFNKFMDQEGCTTGDHRWNLTKDETSRLSKCKVDWHQTGSNVVISVFAKCSNPDKTKIKANQVSIDIQVQFEDSKLYADSFQLHGVVDVSKSSVKLLGTKVEITLKKRDPINWSQLRYAPPVQSSNKDGDK